MSALAWAASADIGSTSITFSIIWMAPGESAFCSLPRPSLK